VNIPINPILTPDISQEPHLPLGQEHGRAERTHGRIPRELVEEPPAAVQPLKVPPVLLPAEEVQVPDLDVRRELALVVVAGLGFPIQEEPVEVRFGVDEFGMDVHEGPGAPQEGRGGACVVAQDFVHAGAVAVFHAVVAHEAEDVIVDVAVELGLIYRHLSAY